MSQSFEEIIKILKDNHIMTQGSCDTDTFVVIPIKKTAMAIEEWSAQQPEDEVLEALKELYKYSCVAMDNHDHETQRAWKSTGFSEASRKAKNILAKHKERRCRFCNKNIKDCQCADGSDVQTEGAS